MASAAIQMSNQGSNVKSKTTNDLLDNGDLTVLIYNVSTGGTPIYNESFNNVINNGAWSLMLGSNTSHPLDLKYGTNYYIDYLINSENSNFSNNAGAYSNARLEFTSTYGNIASTNLVNNSLKINEDVTYYVQGDLGNDSNSISE